MSEDQLVIHCAPTLAGIKAGSLFRTSYDLREELWQTIRNLNIRLHGRGLQVLPLTAGDGHSLIYVYRPAQLERDLRRPGAAEILDRYGYPRQGRVGLYISRLINRFATSKTFPHEIGLFLGYPPEDVAGFIDNGAAGSKCVGVWKVYGDEQEARRTFARYEKCSRVYQECFRAGRTLERLTVFT